MLRLLLALSLSQSPSWGSALNEQPLDSLLRAGLGSSAAIDADFYTQFSGELTGNWWLLRGDGTNQPGAPVTLTASGGPASQSLAAMSGHSGALIATSRIAGTSQRFSSSAVASPAGSFSLVIANRFNATGANELFLDRGDNDTCRWQFDATNQVSLRVFKTGGTSSTQSSGAAAVTPRAFQVMVVTYQWVSDGASVIRQYINGTEVGSAVTNAVGPMRAANVAWNVNGVSFGGGDGNYRLIAFTEKVLSASTVQAMSDALMSRLTTAAGLGVTISRASAATAAVQDQVITVSNNRQRIRSGGLMVEEQQTNNLLRARDFSVAATWVPVGVTVTSPAAGGRDLSTIPNRLTATAPNATLLQTLALSAATRVSSIDVKRVTGTGDIQMTRDGTNWTTLDSTVCFDDDWVALAPSSSSWVRCALSSSQLNPVIGLRIVTSGDAVDVDWAQDETGALPTSRIFTTTTAATRIGDIYAVSTSAWPTSTGKIRFRYRHRWNGNPPDERYLLIGYDGSFKGVSLSLQSNGVVRARTGTTGTSGTTDTDTPAQTWTRGQAYLLEVLWGGGVVRILRDNVLLATGTSKAMPTAWSSTVDIGGTHTNLDANSNGLVSDFEVYR